MSTPNKAGAGAKTMSSRLANMKFMQRSGASESPNPGTPEQPSTKRQRMSNGTYNSSPGSTPGSEQPLVHTPEEKKRMEASEREAAAKGETKWYLSVQQAAKPVEQSPLRIISTGYGALDSGNGAAYDDSEDDEDAAPATNAPGRMNFGNFNKKQPKQQENSGSSGESSSESESESEDEGDDPTGAKALIKQSRKEAGDRARAERKAQRKAESKEAARLAESRRKKEVNLNKVTSISGSGKPSSSAASMTCHSCGKKGHIKAQCPDASQRPRKPRT